MDFETGPGGTMRPAASFAEEQTRREAAHSDGDRPQELRVVVTGVRMGFGNMVALLFKLGLAAIPAALLLALVWAMAMAVFAALSR